MMKIKRFFLSYFVIAMVLLCSHPALAAPVNHSLATYNKIVAVPTISLTASPQNIISGTSAVLSWTSENAELCTTSWGDTGLVGRTVTPVLNRTEIFWVQCSNRLGQTSREDIAVVVEGNILSSDIILNETYPQAPIAQKTSQTLGQGSSPAKFFLDTMTATSTRGTINTNIQASSITAAQVGLLVNDNDPASVEIAEYYRVKRGIPITNIVHLRIPLKTQLTSAEFIPLKTRVDNALSVNVQVLAIAWTNPSRVDCNSITSAFARGFMDGSCSPRTCGLTENSPYYDSISKQPYTDFHMRPAMMLAGKTVNDVKAMIDRGVASDNTFPTGQAHVMWTTDLTRSLRALRYQPSEVGTAISSYVDVAINKSNALVGTTDTLFYFQGLARVRQISTNQFPLGAVADHLTSFGGRLTDSSQMSCLEFVTGANGATGTFGTVSEPCAYASKFPDPKIMIQHYTNGETMVEAYWKSVQQTFQGIFIGEPLARPWGSASIPSGNLRKYSGNIPKFSRAVELQGLRTAASSSPSSIPIHPSRKSDATTAVFNKRTSTLIFHSGFEGTTNIEANPAGKNEKIIGIDSTVTKPNDWVTDFENNPNIGVSSIQYEGGTASQRFAKIVTDPTKTGNKVLHFWLGDVNVLNESGVPSKGRIQQNMYGNRNLKEVYESVRVYLPMDMATVKNFPHTISWLTISEWWNNAGWTGELYPFRVSLNIVKPVAQAGTPLYFGIHGQTLNATTNKYEDIWQETNSYTQIPIGKWVTLEYYFREGDRETGRFYLAMTPDGDSKKVIFDIRNFTHHPDEPSSDGLRHINPMKLYTSKELIEFMKSQGKALQIYWDDFEFRSWE